MGYVNGTAADRGSLVPH